MALFDIFKRGKQERKSEKTEKKKVKEIKKAPQVKVEKEEKLEVKKKPRSAKKTKIIYGVLKRPHITEKATDLAKNGKYTFKVYSRANKIEIKKAVEALCDVNVLSVNVVNIHRKQRRLGKTRGFKSGFKKAVIQIKKGQKIEILPTT